MAMSEQKRKPIGEYAVEALLSAKRPMHNTELVEAMQKLGWVCTGANPLTICYASVHDWIKRRKETSPIKLLGNQTFCAVGFEGEEFEAPTKKAGPGSRAPKQYRSTLPMASRTCGNCAMIEYTGPTEGHLKYGTCGSFERSGRSHCPSDAEACEFWRQRSAQVMRTDRDKKLALQALVRKINMGMPKKRGYE